MDILAGILIFVVIVYAIGNTINEKLYRKKSITFLNRLHYELYVKGKLNIDCPTRIKFSKEIRNLVLESHNLNSVNFEKKQHGIILDIVEFAAKEKIDSVLLLHRLERIEKFKKKNTIWMH